MRINLPSPAAVRSFCLSAVALIAAVALVEYATDRAPLDIQAGKLRAQFFAPVPGQDNGALTSTLPTPNELHRRLRERSLAGVTLIETNHHQTHRTL